MRGPGREWFRKARLRESNEELGNPGCGWYHIYPFVLETPPKLSLAETEVCLADISREEQLVLARVDIGEFRSCELPPETLSEICGILELFRLYEKQMILRFVYDSEGKGIEREPQSLSLVKRHMEQLGPLICRFSAEILVLQGILVGSWGEMHHSKFLADSDLAELTESLDRAAKGSCYLAVRTPKQWRRIMSQPGIPQALRTRLGLFNDGMFGSVTDLGTYGEGERQEELEWQERTLASVPNGGEALAGKALTGYRQAAQEMAKVHLSYLNSSYQKEQLDYWKGECVRKRGVWKGLSGYEYIGRHLGYRFVVCKVKAVGRVLEITVENRGFACVYEETECILVIEGADGVTERSCTGIDASKWESGKKIVLRASLAGEERQEEGRRQTGEERQTGEKWRTGKKRIFLSLRRKRDGKLLRFANSGGGERVLLGTWRGAWK